LKSYNRPIAVAYPSLVTAFTVIASLEVAGRMKGATGLFDWIGQLPWRDPILASVALGMIAFVFGVFGGMINAAYVQASYGDNFERLSIVKAKYDPANLFRVNQNIAPAATRTSDRHAGRTEDDRPSAAR
jgi:berberine-like enzyme